VILKTTNKIEKKSMIKVKFNHLRIQGTIL